MKTKELLRLALLQMYEAFSDEDKALCKFDWYFNTFIRSFTDLRVSPKHVAGRQDMEINDQQRIEEDMQRLEYETSNGGAWLFTYQLGTGEFDIINFEDAIPIIKLLKEFESEKNVKAFLVGRAQ